MANQCARCFIIVSARLSWLIQIFQRRSDDGIKFLSNVAATNFFFKLNSQDRGMPAMHRDDVGHKTSGGMTMTSRSIPSFTLLSCLALAPLAMMAKIEAFVIQPASTAMINRGSSSAVITRRVFEDEQPSDYDSSELMPLEKDATVDLDDNDVPIRDALKRELLLLASVTNRGEYATSEEIDIIIDLVTQLEALNPTPDPSSNCVGEWDLALSSTQLFRSSPFFQTIRSALGDEYKAVANNGFDLHDRATTVSRIGRVRQTITPNKLISEVDLEVGIAPGIPIRIKGTVRTSADLKVISQESWELRLTTTQVKGSNVPLFNQFLDDLNFELPAGDIFSTFSGDVPVVKMKVRTSCRSVLQCQFLLYALMFLTFLFLSLVIVGNRHIMSMKDCALREILMTTFLSLRRLDK